MTVDSFTRRFARRTLVTAASAATLLSLAAPASAAPRDSLGTYRGAVNVEGIRQYEAWRGGRVHRVLDFLADDDWSKIAAPTWWVDGWSASPYRTRLVYSVPLLPRGRGTLARGARGRYDRHFRRLATLLVRKGQARVTLRLGWEFNGDWYRWHIGRRRGAAHYAAYWRRIVRTMRAVPGAAFKFDWCTNNGSVPWDMSPEPAYPGDAYVDYVSQDVYDQSWPAIADPARRWRSIHRRPFGLRWLVRFADRHDKRIALPEWGLGYDAYGGGDDPYFIRKMHRFIARHRPAYHNQWEYTEAPRLMTGRNPWAARAFLRRFSGPGAGR